MKVFISVDMEGVSGLVRWEDVTSQGIDYEKARHFLTGDANAAIAGAFDAGADEVIVEENHGIEDLCNILMGEIDPRCRVVRGPGRPFATTMSALDGNTSVVFLVGHHARAGSRPGIMAHTVSYAEFRAVRIGGRDCGEPDLFAIRAGELGVPIGLVTGDLIVAEQVKDIAPWVEEVIVKEALSNRAGNCIPPERARRMISDGARKAVERTKAGKLQPYTAETAPFEIEVELKRGISDTLRHNLELLPEYEIVTSDLIRTQASDMGLGFRRIAYLSYGGGREGLTRY